MIQFIHQSFIDSSVCDEVLNYYQNNVKDEGKYFNGSEFIVDKNIKDSVDCVLEFNCDTYKSYTKKLIEVAKEYIEEYSYSNAYAPWGIVEPINIQYYKPGAGYKTWHTENCCANSTRHLAFMTYLNDVNVDGETEFYYQDIKVKPMKGKTLIWPTDWTFTHRGIPAMSEDKYIITGWFNYLK